MPPNKWGQDLTKTYSYTMNKNDRNLTQVFHYWCKFTERCWHQFWSAHTVSISNNRLWVDGFRKCYWLQPFYAYLTDFTSCSWLFLRTIKVHASSVYDFMTSYSIDFNTEKSLWMYILLKTSTYMSGTSVKALKHYKSDVDCK